MFTYTESTFPRSSRLDSHLLEELPKFSWGSGEMRSGHLISSVLLSWLSPHQISVLDRNPARVHALCWAVTGCCACRRPKHMHSGIA